MKMKAKYTQVGDIVELRFVSDDNYYELQVIDHNNQNQSVNCKVLKGFIDDPNSVSYLNLNQEVVVHKIDTIQDRNNRKALNKEAEDLFK